MLTRSIAGLMTMCALLLPAQNSTHRASFAVQYNPQLEVSSRSDLNLRLHAAFTAGTAHPEGISNCAQLLDQRREAQKADASAREIGEQRSTLATCLVLEELRRARPARLSYLHELRWNEKILPLLPPRLAITVSAESERAAARASRRGKSWLQFDPSITATADGTAKGAGQIEVTGQGFREVLILWGRGDFDGDGNEDLLIQSLDTLTEGTFRNTRLLVLTRRRAHGKLLLVRSLL